MSHSTGWQAISPSQHDGANNPGCPIGNRDLRVPMAACGLFLARAGRPSGLITISNRVFGVAVSGQCHYTRDCSCMHFVPLVGSQRTSMRADLPRRRQYAR